jgi:hypothetical protein
VIGTLARPPLARALRAPRVWLAVAAWCALAVGVALATRLGHSTQGASHVLVGIYAGVALPLMTYAVAGTVVGPRSIAVCIDQLAAFGAPRARAAAVAIVVAMATCALAGAIVAAAVAVIAHGPDDPPAARDAFTSAYAGALGGAAYAAWFALGSAFGRRGGGRTLLLVVDWILGASHGAGALITPRAHLRNLLGGAPPMALSERASASALVILAIVCTLIAARRTRR